MIMFGLVRASRVKISSGLSPHARMISLRASILVGCLPLLEEQQLQKQVLLFFLVW